MDPAVQSQSSSSANPAAHLGASSSSRTSDLSRGGRLPDEQWKKPDATIFVLLHALPLLAFFTGAPMKVWIICAVSYTVRMFFITAGYHRYFAHRSYTTNRVFQFILAFGGGTAAQKGALWWASHHRVHHRFSDTDRDLHSPIKGVVWSHIGWIMCEKSKPTLYENIGDFAKYPELRFLNKQDWIPPWTLGIATFLIGGWSGLLIGFFLSTVLLWHGTFLVNSAAHLMGRRRYATSDTSRNSAIIALFTLGEGWHNNHHYYPASARQGFYWWEYDVSFYVLNALSWVGLVHGLKTPPEKVRASARLKDGAFDVGMFRNHWRKAAAAVSDSRQRASAAVGAGRAHAAHSIDERREALAMQAAQARDTLEDVVESTLHAADEVGRLTRRLKPNPSQT